MLKPGGADHNRAGFLKFPLRSSEIQDRRSKEPSWEDTTRPPPPASSAEERARNPVLGSASGTMFILLLVAVSDGQCVDSVSWYMTSAPSRTCDWVGELPSTRCDAKGLDGRLAYEECLESCGCTPAPVPSVPVICGRNNSDTWHKAAWPSKGCFWVAEHKPRCDASGEDGSWAYESCPNSCGCTSPPTPAPVQEIPTPPPDGDNDGGSRRRQRRPKRLSKTNERIAFGVFATFIFIIIMLFCCGENRVNFRCWEYDLHLPNMIKTIRTPGP